MNADKQREAIAEVLDWKQPEQNLSRFDKSLLFILGITAALTLGCFVRKWAAQESHYAAKVVEKYAGGTYAGRVRFLLLVDGPDGRELLQVTENEFVAAQIGKPVDMKFLAYTSK